MADKSVSNQIINDHVEVTPRSPGVDYGLRNDDGFDPSKYDFYNQSYRSTGKAFVVRLDEQQLKNPNGTNEAPPSHVDFYEFDSLPPLSPIEELDDDLSIPKPRRQSDPGFPAPIEDEGAKADESSLASLDVRKAAIDPLEKRSELLFSRQHLQLILADQILSSKFTEFLRTYRPDSVPVLAYYLNSVKALKTLKYAESIIKGLERIPGHEFTAEANSATMTWVMEDKADRALDVLVKDDLPAFIAYVYVRTVDVALVDRVTGREDPKSRGIADGLAEVFVLSDPSRPDNPIVFSSEEFHRMTGYPRSEFLGRNCRTLGGPRTSPFGITRFRASLDAEREHCEVLLNYRKDGSPFINLIMCVPLRDQSGKVRYYLGAQLDISDLIYDCTGLASLSKLVERHDENRIQVTSRDVPKDSLQPDEFDQLSEALDSQELERLVNLRRRKQLELEEKIVYKDFGRNQGREEESLRTSLAKLDNDFQLNGQGSAPPLGYYKTYLLVRPSPSLRILFASPDLRIPGILQSPLMNSIGGSPRVREDLAHALEMGRKVTAKVQWLSKTAPRSRARWIHCTPLLGVNDAIGVWMVILVDDEDDRGERDLEPTPSEKRSQLRPHYTTEVLPWDTERRTSNIAGVSTSVWSETGKSLKKPRDETPRPKPRRPPFQQPTDVADPVLQTPFVARPGPSISGKAHSVNWLNGQGGSIDDLTGSPAPGLEARSTSQGSTITPIQSTMQPKIKIVGESGFPGDGARKRTINLPGRSNNDEDNGTVVRPLTRRTYKSLSPYGILFEE